MKISCKYSSVFSQQDTLDKQWSFKYIANIKIQFIKFTSFWKCEIRREEESANEFNKVVSCVYLMLA